MARSTGARGTAYVVGNLVYAFGVGLGYAAFTAMALDVIGAGSAATKYNALASIANFPAWWLGLVLARVAGDHGVRAMLYTEAAVGAAGVAAFVLVVQVIKVPKPVPDLAADIPGA